MCKIYDYYFKEFLPVKEREGLKVLWLEEVWLKTKDNQQRLSYFPALKTNKAEINKPKSAFSRVE